MRLWNEALLGLVLRWRELWDGRSAEAGQTLAEYSLLITVVSVVTVVVAVIAFRETLTDTYTGVMNCLDRNC